MIGQKLKGGNEIIRALLVSVFLVMPVFPQDGDGVFEGRDFHKVIVFHLV